MTFRLVVPDLHIDSTAQAPDQTPMLAALGSLLAGAISHGVDAGWRSGLWNDAGMTQQSFAPGTVAAWGLRSAATGGQVALAQPVHQIAGMSRVHLHPAGVLQLDEAELMLLSESFNRDLGANGPSLRHVGAGLLLEGEWSPSQSDESQEPSRFRGKELASTGAQVPPELRRLGAEAEMWLYEHPLNRARERRGLLAVNALWLWGAGPVTDRASLASTSAVPVAYGDDPFLIGLWTALNGELRPRVSAFEAIPGTAAVAVTQAYTGDSDALLHLESQWFAPLLDAIESRRIPELRLWLGAHRWSIRRRGISRWWRTPAPWWESFAS
jgi:hypothetical protein